MNASTDLGLGNWDSDQQQKLLDLRGWEQQLGILVLANGVAATGCC